MQEQRAVDQGESSEEPEGTKLTNFSFNISKCKKNTEYVRQNIALMIHCLFSKFQIQRSRKKIIMTRRKKRQTNRIENAPE